MAHARLLGVVVALVALGACSSRDRGESGTACGDTRCASSQVCCIDCDGHGTCGPAGTVCAGIACLDAGPPTDDAGPPADDAGPPSDDAGPSPPCGSVTCGAGETCIQRQACPSGFPPEPECIALPTSCGEPSCACFGADPCGGCAMCTGVDGGVLQCTCTCICAAPDTPIETPDGERPIASLRAGDLVYSMHRGELVAVPLRRVGRSPAPRDHAVVRVELANGRVIEMSPGHPSADGVRFGALAPGDALGSLQIAAVELVPYGRPYTYDILPDSDSGTYVAAGALVGSTLADR